MDTRELERIRKKTSKMASDLEEVIRCIESNLSDIRDAKDELDCIACDLETEIEGIAQVEVENEL